MQTIIFDFDYTLADSSVGAIKCICYALKKLKNAPPDENEIRKTIGMSLNETYTFLTGELNKTKAKQFSKYFIEKADQIMSSNTILFPDTTSTILRLHKRNYRLGIVSTKFRYRIIEVLRRERLDSYFDAIIGGEDVKSHKPDPEGLFAIIDHFNIKPQDVLYVGDSIVDAKTAINAGVRFVALLTGVTSKEEFEEYNVEKIIPGLAHLC